MASLTIRNLPDDVRDKLRVRAAQRGLSMEAEARAILSGAVSLARSDAQTDSALALQDWIAAHRKPLAGKITNKTKDSLSLFIRDKRRDAILEAISDGLDPAAAFGENFTRILAEAGWTAAHVRKLSAQKS
jgi:plasmid stability protein